MAGEISKLFVVISAKTDEFQKEMKGISSTMTKVGVGIMAVGTAIVGSLIGITVKTAAAGDEIAKMRKRTGLGTVALSEYKYVADLCGTSLGSIETAIKRMQVTLVDANNGLGMAVDALAGLNLKVEDLIGLSPEEQFSKITGAIAEIEDPTIRAATAVDIFGRSGTDMLPMLSDGVAGLQAMKQEAHELGVIFDEEAAKAAEEFTDAMTRLKVSFQKAGQQVAEALMPVLTDLLNNKIVPIIQKIADWIDKNKGLVEWLLKIGGLLVVGGAILVGLGMVSKAIIAINTALAIFHGLSGPAGWVKLAAGMAAAGVAIAAMSSLMGGASAETQVLSARSAADLAQAQAEIEALKARGIEVPGYQYGGIVPGPIGRPVPVIAHGGEVFAGVHGEYGGGLGNTYNINVGTLLGDEISLRKFARMIKGIVGEDNRRNTFGQVNRGYYFGRSSI